MTPQAWCGVAPRITPGLKTRATPRTSKSGARRWTGSHEPGWMREEVWVVGEEGPPAGGARAGDRPGVRAEPVPAGRGRHEEVHRLRARPFADRGPEQLLVPVVRQAPGQEGEARGPVRRIVGELGFQIEERVLDGLGGQDVGPRLHARPEAGVHRVVLLVPVLQVAAPGEVEADGASEPVRVDRPLSEHLGEPARRCPDGEIELEQAFARGHEAVGEPQVVERRGDDGRDAETVSGHRDRCLEAADTELAVDREERGRGLGTQGVDEVGHAGGEPSGLAVGTTPA